MDDVTDIGIILLLLLLPVDIDVSRILHFHVKCLSDGGMMLMLGKLVKIFSKLNRMAVGCSLMEISISLYTTNYSHVVHTCTSHVISDST